MYKYGFIDAQYLLRRNSFRIYREYEGKIAPWTVLMQSFLHSVAILRSEVGFDQPILLWDSGPYRKCNIIKSYKSDRNHISLETLRKAEAYYEEYPSGESLELLKDIQHEYTQEENFNRAKAELLKNTSDVFPSLIAEGIEGDDWAVMLTLLPELTEKSVLLSIDSDWMYMITESLDLYRMTKNPTLYTYEDIKEEWELDWWFKFIGKPFHLMHYKACYDIYYGNHDNVKGISHKCKKRNSLKLVDFESYFKDISLNSISEYRPDIQKRIKKYYKALDSRRYLSEFKELIERTLKRRNSHEGQEHLRRFLESHFIQVSPDCYKFN